MSLAGTAASWLGPILLQAGADQLKRMLNDGTAGQLIGGVIEQIAGKLGVQPTQAAIEAAYKVTPTEVIQAVQEVDEHYSRIEEARSATMISQHQLQQAELGAGLLARVGRPLNMIFFAVECLALMLSVCLVVLRGIPPNLDFNQVAPLLALVVPVLTAQAGLAGWDSRQQSLAARGAR